MYGTKYTDAIGPCATCLHLCTQSVNFWISKHLVSCKPEKRKQISLTDSWIQPAIQAFYWHLDTWLHLYSLWCHRLCWSFATLSFHSCFIWCIFHLPLKHHARCLAWDCTSRFILLLSIYLCTDHLCGQTSQINYSDSCGNKRVDRYSRCALLCTRAMALLCVYERGDWLSLASVVIAIVIVFTGSLALLCLVQKGVQTKDILVNLLWLSQCLLFKFNGSAGAFSAFSALESFTNAKFVLSDGSLEVFCIGAAQHFRLVVVASESVNGWSGLIEQWLVICVVS